MKSIQMYLCNFLKIQETSQSLVDRQILDTLTKKITEVDMMHQESYKRSILSYRNTCVL
jgi:hypothetical protein